MEIGIRFKRFLLLASAAVIVFGCTVAAADPASTTGENTVLIDRAIFWNKLNERIHKNEVFEYDYSPFKKDKNGKKVIGEDRNPVREKRHEKVVLAYILATSYRETMSTLNPAASERCMSSKSACAQGFDTPAYAQPNSGGIAYYGQGLAQLTLEGNYRKFGKLLGIDLVNKPDLALETANSIRIVVDGSRGSMFTDDRIENYLSPTVSHWVLARGVVNPNSWRKRSTGYLACRFYDAVQPAYKLPAPAQDPTLCMKLQAADAQ